MITFRNFIYGIVLKGQTSDLSDNIEGSIWHNSTGNKIKAYLNSAVREFLTTDQAQTITNKSIDADTNTISNIDNADIKSGANIARNKLASGNSYRIVTNDTSGVMTDAAAITAAKALISDANGIPTHSSVTATELAALAGLSGDILTTTNTKTVSNKTLVSPSIDEINDITDINGATGITLAITSDTGQNIDIQATGAGSVIVEGLTIQTNTISATGNISLSPSGSTAINSSVSISGQLSLSVSNDTTTGTAADVISNTTSFKRFTSGTLVSIRGITASAFQGSKLTISNTTGNSITLLNEDLTATATTRILTGVGADIPLANDASIELIYDQTSARWRVIGGTGGSSLISLVAGENLLQNDALYISKGTANGDIGRTAGLAYKLDASNDNRMEFVGFATKAVSTSENILVQTGGELPGFSGLTEGSPLWADYTTPGAYTQTAPSVLGNWLIPIGTAISATKVLVNAAAAATASYLEASAFSFTVANNTASQNISSLTMNGAAHRAMHVDYSLRRGTDTAASEVVQIGRMRIWYNTQTSTYSINTDYSGDDCGATFSITAGGQVQVSTTDITGTNYFGEMRFSVMKFEVGV